MTKKSNVDYHHYKHCLGETLVIEIKFTAMVFSDNWGPSVVDAHCCVLERETVHKLQNKIYY